MLDLGAFTVNLDLLFLFSLMSRLENLFFLTLAKKHSTADEWMHG